MTFDIEILKLYGFDTLARMVLLCGQIHQMQKQFADAGAKFNPLNPVPVALEKQIHADTEELRISGVLDDDDIEKLFDELESGTDVLEIVGSLIAQYRAQGIGPRVAPKPTKLEVIRKAFRQGVTPDELWEHYVQTIMAAFENPGQQAPPVDLDEDDMVQKFEYLGDPWAGMTEDEISELVHLEGEPLRELLAEMVADGLIVEHEGVYLPLPVDDFAE
jgi:hypothetical protein